MIVSSRSPSSGPAPPGPARPGGPIPANVQPASPSRPGAVTAPSVHRRNAMGRLGVPSQFRVTRPTAGCLGRAAGSDSAPPGSGPLDRDPFAGAPGGPPGWVGRRAARPPTWMLVLGPQCGARTGRRRVCWSLGRPCAVAVTMTRPQRPPLPAPFAALRGWLKRKQARVSVKS